MSFSRVALSVFGIALVAGAGYGILQSRTDRSMQRANVVSVLGADEASLPGIWTSVDDGAYQVTFGEDGTVVEQYGSEIVSRGTFRLAAEPTGYVSTDLGFEKGDADSYLLEDLDGERYAYRVIALTANRLELSYLERGNVLAFTR